MVASPKSPESPDVSMASARAMSGLLASWEGATFCLEIHFHSPPHPGETVTCPPPPPARPSRTKGGCFKGQDGYVKYPPPLV